MSTGAQTPSAGWSDKVSMSASAREGSQHSPNHAHKLSEGLAGTDSLPVPVLHSSRRSRRFKKSVRIRVGSLAAPWRRLKSHIGVTSPSAPSLVGTASPKAPQPEKEEEDEEKDEVDEVVVDRIWTDENSEVPYSENGEMDRMSGSHPFDSDISSLASFPLHDGVWARYHLLAILRWRIWPLILAFFQPKFSDEKAETHYRQESWYLRKTMALWSAVFFVVNWVLGAAFVPGPVVLMDSIFYYGLAPVITLPLLLMVMYDSPRDRPVTYQIFLWFSTWSWPIVQILFIVLCGKYNKDGSPGLFTCGTKDFLITFYYTTALQTVALFGLRMNRFPAMIGALTFFILACCTLVPKNTSWARNSINFLVYQLSLIYMHFMAETAERRVYTLRDQLKTQFKATQRAQVNERKASDSKRRLTSYVFHEVRVPLNTALLAVQNMEASGTVAKGQEIEFNALAGSLSMMSKVLNDVLDFNRMDSGRFESVSRPYSFHQVMHSMFIPLRLATNARGLGFVFDLDHRIDQVARRSSLEATGVPPEAIEAQIQENPEAEGMVVGDETRLRQIITNLASNACKFTPAGGQLKISTHLVLPAVQSDSNGAVSEVKKTYHSPTASADETDVHTLSDKHLSEHNRQHGRALETIVVRIEVTDTGYGIRPKDMVQSKLFSAFNQTEQGRQQGGKGTGLGLALVRQIVKLSGGRLGVRSKVGQGSTFWVELPLGVGSKALNSSGPPPPASVGPTHPDMGVIYDVTDPVPEAATATGEGSATPAESSMLKVPNLPTQSSSALHSIMEQGGRFELVLSRYESHSSVPTRTIGDSSTGTQYPVTPPSPTLEPKVLETPPPPLPESTPEKIRKAKGAERPTFVPMPSPRNFALEGPPAVSPTLISPAASDYMKALPTPSSISPSVDFGPGIPVLVVDDDPLTRTLMKRMLSRLGCKVSTAVNGEAALELILSAPGETPASDISGNAGPILERESTISVEESKFAIVFLDNQMPVMSGLKAVATLREKGRKDFVVGVTGNALLTDQQEYLEAGADYVLTKPVLERSLKSMLALAEERRNPPKTPNP